MSACIRRQQSETLLQKKRDCKIGASQWLVSAPPDSTMHE